MIHPALYKLIRLQGRAFVRRILRGAKSPGRAAALIIGAMVCIGWLILASSQTLRQKSLESPATIRERVQLVMPVALLGICIITAVTSAGDKAIAFTPGEVDQLFPGPFTRRELLAYKLIKSTLGAVLTASILSILLMRHAQWWPACFAGVFLSLLFIQFFTITLLLSGQAVGTAAYTRFRKGVVVLAVLLALLGGRYWLGMGAGNIEQAVKNFRSSPIGNAVLTPFDPFGKLMTATTLADLLRWAALAALLNAGLVVLVLLLDAHYLETAIAASERRYAKIQRVRAGAFLSVGASKTADWQLPQFPWAGGAGPVAWRQITSAARSSRGLLLLLLIVAIGAAPALAHAKSGGNIMDLLSPLIGSLTFLCATMFTFDFRGDVDHMENLKALPLRPWAVASGELVAPVLVLSSLHFLLLGTAAVMTPGYRKWLIAGMLIVIPFNMLIFSMENLIFLLFPSRPAAVSPGDFQAMGSKFVFLIARVIVLSVVCAFAGAAGWIVWGLSGRHLAPAAIAAAFTLAGEACCMIPALAWAYGRYDPSIHTPA